MQYICDNFLNFYFDKSSLPMMKKKLSRPILLLCALISVISVKADNHANRHFQIAQYFEILHSLVRDLDAYYVDTLDMEKVFNAGIEGVLSETDPYTNYIPEKEVEDFKYMTTGEYAGVGALISMHDGKPIISEPYENMPAHKAGLRFGDEIVAIDGESMEAKEISYVSERLRGLPNSEVLVTVRREGEKKPLKIKIQRQKIVMPQVVFHGMLNDEVGYIYLEGFTDKATQEVRQALLDLKARGVRKLILDLRDNGGGLMAEAVSICNLFVPQDQEIVSIRGKDSSNNRCYKTQNQPIDTQIPLVILVNQSTASSSEIVAGAMQDLDRAVIIGERSYGKGLVQATRELPYDGLLKLTTSKYYIPSGRCIQAIDYKMSHENGQLTRVPDSLTQVFHTRSGREVRDGGGIRPDVEVKEPNVSTLAVQLSLHHFYFDFANAYLRSHPTIAEPSKFRMSDQEYLDFKQQVLAKGVSYDLQSRKLMDSFKKILKEEGLYGEVAAEFEALDAKLNQGLDRHLDFFRPEIQRFVEIEIIKRYYYQKGAHEYMLREDNVVAKALEILRDDEKYNGILCAENQ